MSFSFYIPRLVSADGVVIQNPIPPVPVEDFAKAADDAYESFAESAARYSDSELAQTGARAAVEAAKQALEALLATGRPITHVTASVSGHFNEKVGLGSSFNVSIYEQNAPEQAEPTASEPATS